MEIITLSRLQEGIMVAPAWGKKKAAPAQEAARIS
jgi:hypothetical protein